jgi:pimeloyl-ACP methyl ester carboxylesterase
VAHYRVAYSPQLTREAAKSTSDGAPIAAPRANCVRHVTGTVNSERHPVKLPRMKKHSAILPFALLPFVMMQAAPTLAAAASAAGSTPATAPPPLQVNLDAFDARKKLMPLSDGETLAYIDMGNPTGRPVVLIHGYTDNARDWVPLIPYLSKNDRLILVDIRGHGQSSKPECCYSRLDFAYDIKLLMDGLGVQKADIVGHSLGSIIAQTFAEYWPEKTNRVVLISSTGGWPPSVPRKAPQFDFASEIRKLKEPIEPDSPFMIAWWDSPTPVDPDFIRRQRKDSAGIPLRVWLAVLDQGLPTDAYADLQGTLPRLKAPTLLIWGSKDPIMEEPVRQSLRKGLPSAKVKIFDGLGHNPFWENPQAVGDVLNAFLID